jgi:hypothetical protein
MRLRRILTGLGMLCFAATANAQIGSVIRERFVLSKVAFPVPEGDFVFAAMKTRRVATKTDGGDPGYTTFADVFHAQIDGRKLRAGLVASALMGSDIHWQDEPCKRPGDVLFRSDLSKRSYHQNCLLVYAMKSSSLRAHAFASAWLASKKVEVPGDVLIVASITRFDRFNFAAAEYLFNPAAVGCSSQGPTTSIDKRFIDSVIEWGKFAQRWLDETVATRPPPPAQPSRIYRCSASEHEVPPPAGKNRVS